MPSFPIPTSSSQSLRPHLIRKSTTAKICFKPHDIFVDAKIVPPSPQPSVSVQWEVQIDNIARQAHTAPEEQSAVMYLTQGELGKVLGQVEMGNITV